MNFSKNLSILAALTVSSLLFTACDEGKIYPNEQEVTSSGYSVTVKGVIEGCEDYENSDYGIVVAAFKENDDFAVISKPLSNGDEDVLLKNIDSSVSTVEICVITRLRERIITVASMPISSGAGPDFTFDIGEIDVAPFSLIDHNIFSTSCVQCHGATGTSAASLTLTPDEAYRNLVNVPSTVVDGEMRVSPGDAKASTLWQIVATDISETWSFDHSNLLSAEKNGFIQQWINNGAKN